MNIIHGTMTPVWGVLDKFEDGIETARDAWFLAKVGALAGFTYLILKSPPTAARFLWWSATFFVVRTTTTMLMWMGELVQQIRVVSGWARSKPPPGIISPFIVIGVPLIVAIGNAQEFLGSVGDEGHCQDSLFMPSQQCVV